MNVKMEFLQLKYFQHAARSENFSHTATAFMVPPSSVSVSIKKLESELGVPLFDRTANKLSLNENGKLFLKTADTIFAEICFKQFVLIIQQNADEIITYNTNNL
mgnify:CR=1 FL=1